MQKIPTLFVRDPETSFRTLTREVHPACGWVVAGEGVPTRKFDGTCVMLDDEGRWWARREVKAGKNPPASFVLVDQDPDTGKTIGWEPVEQSAFAKWHAQALAVPPEPTDVFGDPLKPGTYELCGPKVNGNPEGFGFHVLVGHGSFVIADPPEPAYDALAEWLAASEYEGIVWWHPDGRMAKIKRRDFGHRWPSARSQTP
jgi:hypothetical protein